MTMNRKEQGDGLVVRQIGENVARRRAELGISRAECAGRAGVPISEVSALEAGDRQPLASTLEKIASSLDWELSDLLGGVPWVVPGEHDHGHIERDRRRR